MPYIFSFIPDLRGCFKSYFGTVRLLNFAPPALPNFGGRASESPPPPLLPPTGGIYIVSPFRRGLERWDLGGVKAIIYTSQTPSKQFFLEAIALSTNY